VRGPWLFEHLRVASRFDKLSVTPLLAAEVHEAAQCPK
jgi:hypothetical protein